ncbi:50S ribosomal protein L11 methyltransferase [Geothermobacter hydrogeniphilus]|uniref:SAM-dependent methyltransferase n=1 Tax=Geothermobacter hydrogeniphilus TaxID=1969733 RepID=A0A1X0Y395_9BACT|nr:50S ribosomal protein L11 methyltransferase [Geothermobacter hydrogeniphilus]ORJ59567.1 SAM-dependent methyltransferase [Geothermobacter hydrogeniphilus]
MTSDQFEIGNLFRIVKPGLPTPADHRIKLIIDKGAFGSGEHETTASCLEMMERMPEINGSRLLDLGSGTGILAIGALKLGADEAVCVDISPGAIRTCEHNCDLNDLRTRVRLVTGTLASLKGEVFDLVVANIYGDLLLDLADQLVAGVKPGGHLLLSGILWEYNFDVRQAYQRLGCELVENRMLKEFSTLRLKRGD